jgi:hypothetical protein
LYVGGDGVWFEEVDKKVQRLRLQRSVQLGARASLGKLRIELSRDKKPSVLTFLKSNLEGMGLGSSTSAQPTDKAPMASASPDPAKVVLERIRHSPENTYAALCELSGVPESTLWHCDHGRDLIQQRIAK